MALDSAPIINAVVSHAMASGHFEQVNGHEPANPPGHGLTAAVWVDLVEPVRSSGLARTSARDFGVSCLASACSHSQPTSHLSQK